MWPKFSCPEVDNAVIDVQQIWVRVESIKRFAKHRLRLAKHGFKATALTRFRCPGRSFFCGVWIVQFGSFFKYSLRDCLCLGFGNQILWIGLETFSVPIEKSDPRNICGIFRVSLNESLGISNIVFEEVFLQNAASVLEALTSFANSFRAKSRHASLSFRCRS